MAQQKPSNRKTPAEVRKEAAALAKYVADQRSRDGDPEGADIIRDLARSILGIRLSKPQGSG